MLLLCLIIKKLYLEINGITAYAFIYWLDGFVENFCMICYDDNVPQ